MREQEENQKKLFLGLSNVWGGRKGGDGDLGRGGAISLVRQLGDRQVGASPTDIVINFVTKVVERHAPRNQFPNNYNSANIQAEHSGKSFPPLKMM